MLGLRPADIHRSRSMREDDGDAVLSSSSKSILLLLLGHQNVLESTPGPCECCGVVVHDHQGSFRPGQRNTEWRLVGGALKLNVGLIIRISTYPIQALIRQLEGLRVLANTCNEGENRFPPPVAYEPLRVLRPVVPQFCQGTCVGRFANLASWVSSQESNPVRASVGKHSLHQAVGTHFVQAVPRLTTPNCLKLVDIDLEANWRRDGPHHVIHEDVQVHLLPVRDCCQLIVFELNPLMGLAIFFHDFNNLLQIPQRHRPIRWSCCGTLPPFDRPVVQPQLILDRLQVQLHLMHIAAFWS
mmetsp:Transcript_33290/g.80287  ORF Transcript_33290/g.80287 Transcript_33290/m.80287 type:complete len:299 (+) Transcript_33290:88-984(+)